MKNDKGLNEGTGKDEEQKANLEYDDDYYYEDYQPEPMCDICDEWLKGDFNKVIDVDEDYLVICDSCFQSEIDIIKKVYDKSKKEWVDIKHLKDSKKLKKWNMQN